MARGGFSTLDKWQIFWIFVNFYIHFGWEICGLLMYSNYQEAGAYNAPPAKSSNPFVQLFDSYGVHDRRYKLPQVTAYGSNIDKMVHAVEVPAGCIDGPLCVLWLLGILYGKWYRYPVQLTVSALHAFGTVVFWGDEFFYGYLSWFTGKGWKSPNTNGPNDFGFWWAFIGTNLVWVVVPMLCCKNALRKMKPALEAHNFNAKED